LRTGADRFDVLRCASVNPVEHYGLDVGLLREGDPADFVVVDAWRTFRVIRTYLRGDLVASNGRSRLPRLESSTPNQFRATARKPEEFAVRVPKAGVKTLHVIEALNGQLITRHVQQAPAILKIAVVNRYARKAPVSVGFIQGIGLKRGAIASSVAHDSHNIVVVGVDDASIAAAVNEIVAQRGGLAAVAGRRRLILPLPIAGLMSDLDGRAVARRYTTLDRMAKQLGSPLDAPFMTLSFMALLVIPDLKMSDLGLFSANRWGWAPVAE
jgi:adenine deaminase